MMTLRPLPLPLTLSPIFHITPRIWFPLSQITTTNASNAIATLLWIPRRLSEIWDSVLRAAPKKKTSHMKKRHRQMAGKALKDVQNVKTCPVCGNIRRTHVLCSHCVQRTWELSHSFFFFFFFLFCFGAITDAPRIVIKDSWRAAAKTA